ncbi:MAG: DUF3592 domain-containing protein [Lachnospiraceae bacterium]|nr:DUF3592 domain-containing protein [Lachnospiraceae bacterium]
MNRLVGLIGSLVGVILGIVIIVMGFKSMSEVKNFPEIEATVVNVEKTVVEDSDGSTRTDVEAEVTYTINGTEYTEMLNSAPTDIHNGDKITVRYNPDKPEYVTAATKGGSIIAVVAGGVCILLSLFMAIRMLAAR